MFDLTRSEARIAFLVIIWLALLVLYPRATTAKIEAEQEVQPGVELARD